MYDLVLKINKKNKAKIVKQLMDPKFQNQYLSLDLIYINRYFV